MQYKYILLIMYVLIISSCRNQSVDELMVLSGQVYTVTETGQLRYVETTLKHPLYSLKWSPDASRYIFTVLDDNGYSIWIGQGDVTYPLTESYDSIEAIWLNNDTLLNTVFAFEIPTQIDEAHSYILDLDTNAFRLYSEGVPTHILPLPSGEQWAEFGTSPGVILYNLNGEKEILEKVRIRPWSFQSVDVSPDGARLIICGRYLETDVRGLYEVSLKPDQLGTVRLVYITNYCNDSRWSPDGHYISLDAEGGIDILDGTTYNLVKFIEVEGIADRAITWAPNSQSVVISTFYDDDESDIYTPVDSPYKTKWRDLTRIYIETDERIRLTKNKGYESIDAWRIIPTEAFPLK